MGIGLVVIICSLSWSATPLLTLRETTILTKNQSRLQLGDIAEFHDIPEDQMEALRKIVISNAPKNNEKRVFSRYAISELLRGPLHFHPVRAVIPEKIHVVSHFSPMHPERIKTDILNYYRSRTNFELVIDNAKIQIGAGDNITNARVQFKDEMPRGSFTLPVEVETPKGKKTLWFSGVLKVFSPVYVLKRAVAPGERILIDDLTTEKRDITHSQDLPATNKDVISARAARSLAAGSIIWRDYLQRQRALQAGESIKLILGSDEWQVSVSGVAQQGGFIGDTIKVTNSSTQRTTSGMIIDKGVVKVQ